MVLAKPVLFLKLLILLYLNVRDQHVNLDRKSYQKEYVEIAMTMK